MSAMIPRLTQFNIQLRLLFVVLLAMLATVGFANTTAAQATGVVTGSVTNQTTGKPLPGADVTLSKFADQTGNNSEDTTVTTDDDGTFRFDGLDTSDGLAYAVSVRYMGVLYGSTMILLSNQPEQQADIAVYDTTTDQGSIAIASRGLIISGVDRGTGLLTATDAYSFAVAGDHTVVEGGDGYSVRFPVPENVDQITPRQGFNFGTARIEETDVLVTTPLLPGETNAGLDYEFSYSDSSIDVPISTAYPTESFRILVPAEINDAEIAITADGVALLDGGIVPINEREYHVWSASSLPAGTSLTLTVSGLPRPPTANRLNTVEPAIVAGLALLAATAITGWIVVSRGLYRSRPIVLAPTVAAPLEERREQLSNELRRVEAAWRAGEIAEVDYRVSRRAVLEDLRHISRQYRGLGDDE